MSVQRLIVPAGSCNSLTSILMGLMRKPRGLKQLFTIGIGPDKLDWVRERLAYMGYPVGELPFSWRHHSLHDTGYSAYSDQFRGEAWEDIAFHPTYEAKMIRWLRENNELRTDGTDGFWIVGSEPKVSVIEPFFTRLET